MRRRSRALCISLALAATAAALVGCTAETTPTPATSSPPPTSTDRPIGSDDPHQVIEFHPDGSAADNLPWFDEIGLGVVQGDSEAGGRDFIDALVAGGFDKTQMQVTRDETTQGTRADSLQWSVLFAGECLVGQYGPASGGYHGVVRPVLGTGGCLVGSTRPIDW